MNPLVLLPSTPQLNQRTVLALTSLFSTQIALFRLDLQEKKSWTTTCNHCFQKMTILLTRRFLQKFLRTIFFLSRLKCVSSRSLTLWNQCGHGKNLIHTQSSRMTGQTFANIMKFGWKCTKKTIKTAMIIGCCLCVVALIIPWDWNKHHFKVSYLKSEEKNETNSNIGQK